MKEKEYQRLNRKKDLKVNHENIALTADDKAFIEEEAKANGINTEVLTSMLKKYKKQFG